MPPLSVYKFSLPAAEFYSTFISIFLPLLRFSASLYSVSSSRHSCIYCHFYAISLNTCQYYELKIREMLPRNLFADRNFTFFLFHKTPSFFCLAYFCLLFLTFSRDSVIRFFLQTSLHAISVSFLLSLSPSLSFSLFVALFYVMTNFLLLVF